MKKIMLLPLMGLLVACGNARFEAAQAQTCTIENDMIVCPDGSTVPVPRDGIDGTDGQAGRDGVDGRDGTQIRVVDPCGDGPGADEVVMIFDDNTVLAWYKDLGFSVLEEGVTYRTTDAQRCKFEIVNGEVFDL